jgi:hypothetical protein
MSARVKSILSTASDALEAAAGYSLIAMGLFGVVFMDVSGSGSLLSALGHLSSTIQEERAFPGATRVIEVPARPTVVKTYEDTRFLQEIPSALSEPGAIEELRESAPELD